MQLLSAANLGQPRGQIDQPPTAHPGTTSPRPGLLTCNIVNPIPKSV